MKTIIFRRLCLPFMCACVCVCCFSACEELSSIVSTNNLNETKVAHLFSLNVYTHSCSCSRSILLLLHFSIMFLLCSIIKISDHFHMMQNRAKGVKFLLEISKIFRIKTNEEKLNKTLKIAHFVFVLLCICKTMDFYYETFISIYE